MFCYAVLVAGLSIAVGLPVEKGQNEPVPAAQSISLLWDELKNLRNEVDHHLHGGLTLYPHDLDQTLREVKQMTHEYHVHYVHHPHEGHLHNETSLRHVEEYHLPAGASKKLQSARQETNNQDHASPRVKDIHDYHGLDLTVDDFGQIDADLFEPDHYTFRSGDDPHVHRETWEVAYCNLEPNVELPESKVKGEIYISQRRTDRRPTLFYDMDVTGFDLTSGGRVYGFHVHEFPVVEGQCSTAGEFLNPGPAAQFFPNEHQGYIGDFNVNDKGELNHGLRASIDEDFHGQKSILGYSIVVHGLGFGDSNSSLHMGRLACCNIILGTGNNIATTPSN